MTGFDLVFERGVLPPPGGPVRRRLAVRAFIGRGDQWLLIRSQVTGDWKFPGGGVEPAEEPGAALTREIAEETGYRAVPPYRRAGVVVERSADRDQPHALFEMESRYYWASVSGDPGPLRLDAYEADLGFEARWVSVGRALDDNRRLVASGRPDLPSWLDRETRILTWLGDHTG